MNFLFYFKDLFAALILRPLLRDPFRVGVAILGVAIGVAVFLSVRLTNAQTMLSFQESVDLALGKSDAVIHADGMSFDEKHFIKLMALRKWIKVYPVIEGYGVESISGEVVEIMGTDLLQDVGVRDFSLKTAEPGLKGLLPVVMDPRGVVLPEKFIPGFQFKPGDDIRFLINGRKRELRVAATLENKGVAKALKGNFAVMDVAAAQLVLDKLGKLDRIDVEFIADSDFDRMKEKISEVLPDFLGVHRPERKNEQVGKMLRAFQYNLTALSFVALLVALYLIYNMVALSVVRRRTEIGVLRALGASPSLVAAIFFLEAGIVGAAGSFLGVGLGYYFAQFSLDAVTLTINNLYAPSYATEVDFHWGKMWPYILLGIGLSLASALIPAYDAARTSPTLVMRRGGYDLKLFRGNRELNRLAFLTLFLAAVCTQLLAVDHFPYFGFLSVFLLILGLSLLSPSALLLARRLLHGSCKKWFGGEGLLASMNLSQNVGRNSLAVSSLAIAFMMVIGMSIMVHSFRQTVIVWVERTLRADLFVRIAGGRDVDYRHTLPPDGVERLKRIPGVAGVDLFRAVDAAYEDEPVVLAASDFSVLSQYGDLAIKSGPPARELDRWMVGSSRAIVSEAFSLKHKVNVGDRLSLNAPDGPLELEIVAVYFDYSRERGYIVLDRTTFLKFYRDPAVNSFIIYLADKNQIANVRQHVLNSIGGDYQLIVRSNAELKKDVLEIFDKTFSITYALEIIAVGVAALGLFNTLISLILERKREMGILRFLGAFKDQIRRMVLIEAGILGLIGSGMGLIAGIIVSYILIFVINKQSFGWTIQVHFPYLFIILTTLFFWAASASAGLYPARLAAKFNPKEAVRME